MTHEKLKKTEGGRISDFHYQNGNVISLFTIIKRGMDDIQFLRIFHCFDDFAKYNKHFFRYYNSQVGE